MAQEIHKGSRFIAKEPVQLAASLGRGRVANAEVNDIRTWVHIFAESGTEDGAFYPAQDIQLFGEKSIESLHTFLGDVLAKIKETKEPKA